MADLIFPSFVRDTQAAYLGKKATYDADGTIFWCTDKPIIYMGGMAYYGVSQEILEANVDGVKAISFNEATNTITVTYLKSDTPALNINLAKATSLLDGLMAKEDKANLDTLVKAIITDDLYAKKTDLPTDFYSKSEVDDAIANAKSQIIGGAGQDYDTLKEIETWVLAHQDLYTALVTTVGEKAAKSYVDEQLGLKANAADVYTKGEVDTELAKKADKSDTYTKQEVDAAIEAVDITDQLEDYAKKEEVESQLAEKANASEVYKKTETYTKDEVDAAIKVTDDKLADYAQKTEVTQEIEEAIGGLNISQYETIEGAAGKYNTKAEVASAIEAAKNEILAKFAWKNASE